MKIMIRIFVGILILLSINEHINAQSDSLTVKLYDFFKSKNEMSENVKPRQTFLIINDLVTFKEFKSQEYGIFKFCTLTTHTFTHILLVNNTIVDMYQPLEKSLYSVLEYLKMNKNFSKEDIFRYIEGVLDLYRSNTESIPWSL